MEEGFRSGNICSGTWWNTARINNGSSSSPCSTAVTDHMGISNSYGWSSEMAEIKASSCEETASSVTGSCSSNIVYNQDAHHKSSQESDSVGGGGGVLMDSTLQIMDFVGLSCPTADHWTQALLHGSGGGTSESNFMNRHHHQPQEQQLQKDWSQKNYSGSSGEDSSISTTTSFLQGLIFDPDHPQHQLQEQNQAIQVPVSYENLGSAVNNFRANSSIPQFLKTSSSSSSSPPKHQLHFPNSTAFWNTSASAMTNNISSGFFPSPSPTQLEEKPNCSILTLKPNRDEVRDKKSSSSSSETTFKRPRIETPTPLPTFKVRKEKLGDRITALQQLVSPFGKTDTASVLFEAIEYIKFLHEQVSALSTPYMKSGGPVQYQQNFSDKSKEAEGSKQDLRSRGLCLVPISSTFPVTTETTADIWTPPFGGTYR